LPDGVFILYFPGIIASAILVHSVERNETPENRVQKPEIINIRDKYFFSTNIIIPVNAW
jgi:hypothetical protein